MNKAATFSGSPRRAVRWRRLESTEETGWTLFDFVGCIRAWREGVEGPVSSSPVVPLRAMLRWRWRMPMRSASTGPVGGRKFRGSSHGWRDG